jgi:hypothetical protein
VRWQLAVPAVLTLALAFRAGGFFAGTTALLAVVLALLLVGRVTLGHTPFAGWSPALAASAGALGLLAVWTLLSVLWSDAPFRALSEFDRTLAYTLVLCLMGTFARRSGDLDRALRLMAAVFAVIAAAALVTRLYPDAFPTAAGKARSRLAFPLTYWNALGVLCAMGITLALHCAAGARQGVAVRILGAGALPVIATTLYLTFSRGGIIAALLGIVVYSVLAHPRRLPLALLAAGLPTALAVKTAYDSDGLATDHLIASETHRVALVVLACSVGAMALRAICCLADRRIDAIPVGGRARRVAWLVAAAVTCATVIVTDLPQRADAQRHAFFEEQEVGGTGDQRDRLSDFGANGRVQHWDVARAVFREHTLMGSGAGTFRLQWERDRDIKMNVVDAHSLYLEVLAELGWPGLLALAVAILTPLGVAAARLRGTEHHAHAAFLAGALVLLVHAGIDWDWEMPALVLWFFALAAVVCAAPDTSARAQFAPGRIARVLAALGCLLLAVAPATVVASQSALDRGTRAFRAADCTGAVDGALDSIGALPSRPEPYELLGYCDLRAGQLELGVGAMQAARARDPDNWEYAYGLAVAQALNRQDPRAAAALAYKLNPLDVRTSELRKALQRGGPGRRARAAARARIPFQ